MANKNIKGITIQIGANTTQLTSALKDVNSIVAKSNSELKSLNQALKLDPKNTELLSQKQEVLRNNIKATTERLNTLKEAQRQMGSYNSLTDEQKESYRALSVEIAKGEGALRKMNGELEASNNGKLDGVTNEANKVGQAFIKVGDIIKANLASEAIVRVFDKVTGKIKDMAGKIKDIASSIGGMVISGGIDRALNLENAKAKMSTFTKSTEQLDEIMKNVQDSVDGTKFSMDAAATVAAGLFAAGIKEGPQMERSLRLVGDAAQVSGRSMDEIGAIFNKVAASGKLTGQELNQLSDSGIPVLQLLADSTGKSVEEVKKLVSAGKIGFEEFSDAMEKGLGGAAQKAGATFTSSLDNLKSALSRMGAEIMTPLLEGITPVMNNVKDIIKKMVAGDDITAEMNALFTNLQSFITTAATHITEMVNKYIPVITQMIQGVISMLPSLLPTILNAIVQIINVLLPQVATLIGTCVGPLLNAISSVLSTIASMIVGNNNLGDTISKLITQIVEFITENLPKILEIAILLITTLAQGLIQSLPTIIDSAIDLLMALIDTILDNLDLIIDTALQLILTLAIGLIDALPKLLEKIPEIIVKLVDALTKPEMLAKIIGAALTLIIELARGLIIALPELLKMPKTIIESLVNKIKERITNTDWGALGSNIIKGICDGFGRIGNYISQKVNQVKDEITNRFKSIFGIHSPSTLMRDTIGLNITAGIGEGIEEGVPKALKEVDAAMKQLNAGIEASVNPTINPSMTYESNYGMMAQAMKEALKDMTIELDDENVGKFVIKTVTEEVYS